jgi:hypothetical protein
MSKKMYYTEAEACTKLHVGLAELTNLVRDQKLRVFMDGSKKMFKVADVDALSGPASSEDIELAPAEGGADAVSLSEADVAKPPTKEDTVITAEGISIFDDEDLQIESADPMAKTQIAPSIEDQTSLEGVGSGSGLLDLTRESDDTSLGAEVLDHIDMTGEVGSGIGSEVAEPVAYQPPQEVMVVEQAADVMDASSGLFGGMAVGVSVVLLMLAAVAMAAMQSAEGGVAGFVEGMKNNIAIILVVSIVVVGVGAAAGFAMGKAVATRQAMKKIGA